MLGLASLSRGLGLAGVSILTFSPLAYGVAPIRILGVNVWLLAGISATVGFVLVWALKSIWQGPLDFPRWTLGFVATTASLFVWATVILALRQREGFESLQSIESLQTYGYLLSPLLILSLLSHTKNAQDKFFVRGLRLTGVLLAFVVLALQTLIHVDLVGEALISVEPTRQMVFQANSVGTTLAMLMLLETKIAALRVSPWSLCFATLALYMSAILYVDSDASVVFGSIILLWFLVSQHRKGNRPKYWSLVFGTLLLLLGALKIRIPSIWLDIKEGPQNLISSQLPNPSIGLRFVDRAASGESPLDHVRTNEWLSLFTPSDLEFFLGWESREITHGNLQLLSSDFGVFFGIVFSFLFTFAVFRLQRSPSAKALLVIFCLDALVTSSFQHLYLCVYFAMISVALDVIHSEGNRVSVQLTPAFKKENLGSDYLYTGLHAELSGDNGRIMPIKKLERLGEPPRWP